MPKSVKNATSNYGAHGAICLSSSRSSYGHAIEALRVGGTLVCLGLAKSELPVSPLMMIMRGLKIIGSSVGTEKEMGELMKMARLGEVKPIVKMYDFQELPKILRMVEENKVAGRVVVQIPQ